MNYIGGMCDYFDLLFIFNGFGVVFVDGVFDYQCCQQDENFVLGEQFIYNNGGYWMLLLVLECIFDMLLVQIMCECLFELFGMYDILLWVSDLDLLFGVV